MSNTNTNSNFDGVLKEFASYLPEKLRKDFKSLTNIYKIELESTKRDVIDSLYKLSEELHPQFLYTTGSEGTLNELEWLIKNKDRFTGVSRNGSPENTSGLGFSELDLSDLGVGDESDVHASAPNNNIPNNNIFYSEYASHLDSLSRQFSELLFGEYVSEFFDSELPYYIAASAFNKMDFDSHVAEGDEGDRRVEIDLSKFGLDLYAYRFVPWTSPLEKTSGKPLSEGWESSENPERSSRKRYCVDMGLKPGVFGSLSTAVTTPVHEIIHHISSHYTANAYAVAKEKAFSGAFKDLKRFFNVSKEENVLFGSVDEEVDKKIKEKGIELRGKDLLDPFILWDIARKHGNDIDEIIANAESQPLKTDKLAQPSTSFQNAVYKYMSSYLPPRLLEEGVAVNLSLNNAGLDEALMPAKFKGLERSVKSIVDFGVSLSKLHCLANNITFYTGEKMFSSYYLPELQLYPVAYLHVANLAEAANTSKEQKGQIQREETDAKWYFDLIKGFYGEKKLPDYSFSSPDFRKIQGEIRDILDKARSRLSPLSPVTASTPTPTSTYERAGSANSTPASGPTSGFSRFARSPADRNQDSRRETQEDANQSTNQNNIYLRRTNRRAGAGTGLGNTVDLYLNGTPLDENFSIESFIYDVSRILGYDLNRRNAGFVENLVFGIVYGSLRALLDNR